VLTDIDKGKAMLASGRDLMENGLKVEITQRPGAVVVTYKKART
jgi:hypothetical protein